MGTNIKEVTVDVIARRDNAAPLGVSFELESDLSSGKNRLQFDKKKDKLKKTDSYRVEFRLKDPDNIGLEFADPIEAAMWVSEGVKDSDPPCPIAASHNSAFSAVERKSNKLVVHNPDTTEENLAFTLRFVTTGPNPRQIPFDPIIENKNGGI
jgi:hypothetical protein